MYSSLVVTVVEISFLLFLVTTTATTSCNGFTTTTTTVPIVPSIVVTPVTTTGTLQQTPPISSLTTMSATKDDTVVAVVNNVEEVKVGDSIPTDIVLMELTDVDGKPEMIHLSELCANRRVILFGVPGAFTPGCSKSHLPSFMSTVEEFKTKHNIDLILCVATNDAYTMEAWGRSSGGTNTGIRFVSDHTGALTNQWGLTMTNPVGIRTKRFTAVIENTIVTHYFSSTEQSSNTWAPAVLAAL